MRDTNSDPDIKDKELAKMITDFCWTVDSHVNLSKIGVHPVVVLLRMPDLERRLTKTILTYLARDKVACAMKSAGQLRKKYEHEVPVLKGSFMQVVGRRIARTGTRYGPSGDYDSYTGESNYECGGLTDTKTHVLYKVRHQIMPEHEIQSESTCNHYDYEIDREYVELVCLVADLDKHKQ